MVNVDANNVVKAHRLRVLSIVVGFEDVTLLRVACETRHDDMTRHQ